MISTKRPAFSAVLALVSCVVLLTGCSTTDAKEESSTLTIAVTVAPLTSIVSAVAGDRAHVEGIVPEGTNSHTFEPAPRVAELLSRADMVITNGLGLEDPTKRLAEANTKSGAAIVEVATQILPPDQWIFDFSFPKEEGKPNPHLWTDPTFAIKYAEVIDRELGARDPANAEYFHANALHFERSAQALVDALRADQTSVSQQHRELLTYHDAYAYFGRTFGWRIIGAVQPRNFSDPTPREVARLIDQIKAEKVPTIFGSEIFPSAVLQEIGRATGARYEDTLRDDDLPGQPGEAEHSWLGLMRYNFVTMVRGLGGQPTRLSAVPLDQSAHPDGAVYPQ